MWTFKNIFSDDKSKKGNKFMLIPGPSFLVLRNVQRGFYGLKKDKIKKTMEIWDRKKPVEKTNCNMSTFRRLLLRYA